MYDDNFDLWNDVSASDFSDFEDSSDFDIESDSLSDPWLDPLDISSSELLALSNQEVDSFSEVDLTQVEDKLSSIERYCNLIFGVLILYFFFRGIRSIVYKFNSHGKGID